MKTKLMKITGALAALLLICFGVVAAIVVNTGEATGTVSVEICRKTADGKWEVIDRGKAPIQCALNYTGASGSTTVSSSPSWSWNFTSEKGRRISATILRAGKARFNSSTGLLELDLPIEVNVDGKRERFTYKQTTESLSTVIGTLTGKRLTTTAEGVSGATVGVGILRNRELIHHLCNTGGKKAPNQANELVVVLRSEGRAILKK
jgi:hypothetical protein